MDGLWTMRLATTRDNGRLENGAVLVVRDGRILGGDGGCYFVGMVSMDGNAVRGTIDVHAYVPNFRSLFDVPDEFYIVKFTGGFHPEQFWVDARIEGRGDVHCVAQLTKQI